MLAEPLAVGPELRAVAVGPELLQVGHPLRAGLAVELVQHAVGGDRREIGAVAGDRGRVVRRRALVVGLHARRSGPSRNSVRAISSWPRLRFDAALEIAVEGGEGGVAVAHLALHPPAGEQDLRDRAPAGSRPSAGARRAPRRA